MKAISKSNVLFYLLFQVSIVFGVLLRTTNLHYHGLWFDEIWSLGHFQSIRSLQEVIDVTVLDRTPPFFNALLNISFKIFGDSVEVGRGLSAFFGILSLPFFYLLCREYCGQNRWIGLFGLFFASLNPLMINFSKEMRPYSCLLFLTVAGYFYLLKFLRKEGRFDFWAWILCLIFALNTHFFAWITVLHQLSWYLRQRSSRRWLSDFKWAIPWIILGLYYPFQSSFNAVLNYQSPEYVGNWIESVGTLSARFFNLMHDWFGSQRGSFFVLVLTACFLLKAIFKEVTYKKNFLFIEALALVTFFLAVDKFVRPLFVTRYFFALCAIFIVGLIGFVVQVKNRWALYAVFLVMIVTVGLDSYKRYLWRPEYVDYRLMVRQLVIEARDHKLNMVGSSKEGISLYAELLQQPLKINFIDWNEFVGANEERFLVFDQDYLVKRFCPGLLSRSRPYRHIHGAYSVVVPANYNCID